MALENLSGYGNITAANCDLQVGAGTIDIDQIDVQKLNADCVLVKLTWW